MTEPFLTRHDVILLRRLSRDAICAAPREGDMRYGSDDASPFFQRAIDAQALAKRIADTLPTE
jgi:hypothetical protein